MEEFERKSSDDAIDRATRAKTEASEARTQRRLREEVSRGRTDKSIDGGRRLERKREVDQQSRRTGLESSEARPEAQHAGKPERLSTKDGGASKSSAAALSGRLRNESESGELANKDRARAREVAENPYSGSRRRALSAKELLERKRQVGREKQRWEPNEYSEALASRFKELEASGELKKLKDAYYQELKEKVRLSRARLEGIRERVRALERSKK